MGFEKKFSRENLLSQFHEILGKIFFMDKYFLKGISEFLEQL